MKSPRRFCANTFGYYALKSKVNTYTNSNQKSVTELLRNTKYDKQSRLLLQKMDEGVS